MRGRHERQENESYQADESGETANQIFALPQDTDKLNQVDFSIKFRWSHRIPLNIALDLE